MNPFAPPTTDVDMAAPERRKPVAFVLLGLSALQLLWMLLCAYAYLELVRTGVTSFLTGLGSLVGCILLYVGAVRFTVNAARGNRLFVAALVCLVWAARGWWGIPISFWGPYALGSAIAGAGWWFSRGAVPH